MIKLTLWHVIFKSVKAERIDENVQDQSKLRFSSNDLSIVRYLVDQVDIFQHKSRVLIVSNKTFPLKNSYKKSSELKGNIECEQAHLFG